MWWPKASLDRLKICAFWMLWLFTWDDVLDRDDSVISGNVQDAASFRNATLKFIKHVLGVEDDHVPDWRLDEKMPERDVVVSFKIVGAEIRRLGNRGRWNHSSLLRPY